MENEKVLELLKDDDFLAELGETASAEDAQKLFADKGADISIDELMALRALIKQKSGAELTDDELAAASGGKSAAYEAGRAVQGGIVAWANVIGDGDAWEDFGRDLKKLLTSW